MNVRYLCNVERGSNGSSLPATTSLLCGNVPFSHEGNRSWSPSLYLRLSLPPLIAPDSHPFLPLPAPSPSVPVPASAAHDDIQCSFHPVEIYLHTPVPFFIYLFQFYLRLVALFLHGCGFYLIRLICFCLLNLFWLE